jgi:hypothetical protein
MKNPSHNLRAIRRALVPAVLAVLSLVAAAWWVFAVIAVPASIRSSLREDLGPFFPGGFRFTGAQKLGHGHYRVRDFRAFPIGVGRPWLTAVGVDFHLAPGGGLRMIRLGRPELFLDAGPDFLPPGSIRIPPGEKVLPKVEVIDGIISGPLPGGGGLRIPWAREVRFVFDPDREFNASGDFSSPLGAFSVTGKIDARGRSQLRAKARTVDFKGMQALFGSAGPVVPWGAGTGVFTFAFGGAEGPILAGNLCFEGADLAGAGVRFRGVRLTVLGAGGARGWNPRLLLHASSACWGEVVLERVELEMYPGTGRDARGRADLWSGRLEVEGSMGDGFQGRGRLSGADLSFMPEGLLGAATPAAGRLDVDFRLDRGALLGDFTVRDARLWSIQLLSGIRHLIPAFGAGHETFSEVRGRFVNRGERTELPLLQFKGGGFELRLCKKGTVGPNRRIDLEFELLLHRKPDGAGIPPMRKVWTTISKELWKPFSRFVQFRIHVRGTLDRPLHQLRPPEIFRK